MAVGIRTVELRKVYTSPPPMAAAGSMFSGPKKKKKSDKKFEVTALAGVSLEIHPGEIFGLLGPNGAGKSTTVGILTTRVRPTSGEAWVGQHEVWREQIQAKRLIGVVQQRPNLDFALTAREILEFHAAYFGIPAKERVRRAGELLERF
jgi:ABC-2 type transport system ATP-binding protein